MLPGSHLAPGWLAVVNTGPLVEPSRAVLITLRPSSGSVSLRGKYSAVVQKAWLAGW